ncbi:MAG: chromosome segregation protein SMC [Rhodomicrobiaceae bacterium]
MHITQLKLLGFKSFVEPTELLIRPGLTGVVGPNGCGKSNLLEALRWVMGETSYKAMRGGAMDDVIFSGTQQRPARNSAEVTITIDNKTRTAPAEFNNEDLLEIVRTIARGDGSSYKVNGRDVRAKDIKLLFEDAATGARSHALVRQGQIGEIVNSKPQARRRILEDAAGIAGLHSRRHEAELRLNAAETNLERLADIMGQMDAQLNSLKRQARHALRYKDLSEKLYAKEALLLHLQWRAAADAVLKAETDLAKTLDLVDGGTLKETEALNKREELQDALPPLREAEAKAAAALHRLTLANEGLDRDEEQARTREAELKSSLTDATTDLARDEVLIKDGEQISLRLSTEIESLETEISELQSKKAVAKTKLDDASLSLQESETLFNELSQSRANAHARRSSLLSDIERLKNQSSQLEGQIQNLETEQTELLTKKAEQSGVKSEDTLLKEITDLEQQINVSEEAITTLDDELSTHKSEVQSLRISSNEMALALQAHETEIALLEKLLKPASETETPIMDELKTQDGYELALWAALGDDLDLPTEATVLDLQTTNYWRNIDLSSTASLPQGVAALSSFIKGPQLLMTRLEFVGVVDAPQALSLQQQLLPGHSLVSKSGGLWRWDGFILSPNSPSSAPQRLTERNRLPLLIEECEALRSNISSHKEKLQTKEEVLSSLETELRDNRLTLFQSQQKLKEANQLLRTLEQTNRQVDGRLAAISESLAAKGEELLGTKSSIDTQDKEFQALPSLDEIDKEHTEQKNLVTEFRKVHSDAHLHWAGFTREEELHRGRIEEMKKERDDWTSRAKDAQSHIDELKLRIEKTLQELTQFSDLPARFNSQRQNLLNELSLAETKRKDTGDALAIAEETANDFEKELRTLQTDLMTLREEKAREETRLEAARSQLIQQASEIETKLNVKADACLAHSGFEAAISLPPMRDVRDDVARLKKDRERLGAVNLRAEDEIKELEDKFGSMISEREDLESAVTKLRTAVNQLNQEGRQRLLTAFDEVNAHFKRLFQTLFAGGEAELKLIDSDDPLEAGLEIIARPPGKRPQVLTLLSGGEKALTAMSLLFAVFLTNPSPICVLDEVDAPLDDTNVDRFCLMMEEMARSTDTRFLVITHHPMTMERMDRLFGVTMSEKGVSQLVSVDLATAEGLLETA